MLAHSHLLVTQLGTVIKGLSVKVFCRDLIWKIQLSNSTSPLGVGSSLEKMGRSRVFVILGLSSWWEDWLLGILVTDPWIDWACNSPISLACWLTRSTSWLKVSFCCLVSALVLSISFSASPHFTQSVSINVASTLQWWLRHSLIDCNGVAWEWCSNRDSIVVNGSCVASITTEWILTHCVNGPYSHLF